jgi:hypothetical protein
MSGRIAGARVGELRPGHFPMEHKVSEAVSPSRERFADRASELVLS